MPQRDCGSDIVRRSWRTILTRVRTGSVRRLSVLLGPRSHASNAVHRDVSDVSGWRVIHRREADLRTEVGVSELLKEFGSSSLGNARRAIYDEVLVEAHGVTRVGFDREGDAAVVADIAHLAMLGKMGGHDLVAIKTGPYHGHLGTAVGVQGHQVSQGRGVEHSSGAAWQRRRHEVTLAVRVTKARRAKSPDRCGKAIEEPNARFCRCPLGVAPVAAAAAGPESATSRVAGSRVARTPSGLALGPAFRSKGAAGRLLNGGVHGCLLAEYILHCGRGELALSMRLIICWW